MESGGITSVTVDGKSFDVRDNSKSELRFEWRPCSLIIIPATKDVVSDFLQLLGNYQECPAFIVHIMAQGYSWGDVEFEITMGRYRQLIYLFVDIDVMDNVVWFEISDVWEHHCSKKGWA